MKKCLKKETKEKWNYAVVMSIFFNLWIGKTKLKPVKNKIFSDIEDAIEKAKELFLERNSDFDPDTEEDEDSKLLIEFNNIREATEDTVDEIPKAVGKFIIA